MSYSDSRLEALAVTFQNILTAATKDPVLAERALRRLNADPQLVGLVEMPPGMKRTGRRAPASLDPFKVLADSGEVDLMARLADLELEELRDIVAQFGMDPRRLVMKWKDAQRVREHIASTTAQRSRKGDAFRALPVPIGQANLLCTHGCPFGRRLVGAGSRRCSGLDMHRRVERAFPWPHVRDPMSLSGGRPGKEVRTAMAGVAVRESVTIAGRAERGRVARAFVGAVLGLGHPSRDDAALLVSELFGNSIRHGGSGAPGETVTVAVTAQDDVIRVDVADRSGPRAPELRPADGEAEDGRGLQLVERLSVRWGWHQDSGQTVTWFEIQALLQPMQHSGVPGGCREP